MMMVTRIINTREYIKNHQSGCITLVILMVKTYDTVKIFLTVIN